MQLTWPEPVQAQIHTERTETLLTFSRPLGQPDFSDVAQQLSTFLRDVRFGYDTVLLVLTPGTRAEFDLETQGVTVHFAQAPSPTPPIAAPAPESRDWRLDYLHAIALLESGDAAAAQIQLRRLARAHPREPEILAGLARATEQVGDWSGALPLYSAAADLGPSDPAAANARDRLWLAKGDQVRTEFGRGRTDGAEEQGILRISGRAMVTPNTRALAGIEYRALDAPAVRRRDGTVVPAELNRTRAEVGIEHHINARSNQISALLGPDSLGLRARIDTGAVKRNGWIEASINEPHWDYVEGLAEGATRDRVAAGLTGAIDTVWQAGVTASLHRYAMDGAGEVADSIGLGGTVSYALHQNAATLHAVYRLDAEYFSDVSQRTAAAQSFAPLPVSDREVHAFGFDLGRADRQPLTYTLGAGYSIDRKGPDAPYFALHVGYSPMPQLLVGLRASYSLAVDDRNDAMTYFGAVGEYRFDQRKTPRASDRPRPLPQASPSPSPPR